VLAAWLLLAVQGPAIRPPHDLGSYLAVAARYGTTDNRAALREISAWQTREIAAAVADLRGQGSRLRPVPTSPGDIDFRAVEAAILLHLEAGLIALQALSPVEVEAHFGASTALFEWSRDAARRQRRRGLVIQERIDRRDYYFALASAVLAIGFPPTALPFAEAAQRIAPMDPEVRLVFGCVAEGIAEEALLQHRGSEVARWREKAERALRDVLALDHGLQEARLHLGKMHLDSGRLIEAEPLLAEVEARSGDARQRYLARLFLGRLAERRGRPDEATTFYRGALVAWPDSQVARLALGHALERRSGPQASRPLVAASLAASQRPDRTADPWWQYPFAPPGLAKAALDRLWGRALDW
jgi:tetratricopeptide (TPR) repeat protein